MRISDWSSDVCSSDLLSLRSASRYQKHCRKCRYTRRSFHETPFLSAITPNDHQGCAFPSPSSQMLLLNIILAAPFPASLSPVKSTRYLSYSFSLQDRTCLVQAKTVSVRIDLGGRRSINTNRPIPNLIY